MTNLPRIRVSEPAGLRRFLYPLTMTIALPDDTDLNTIALQKPDGTGVPLQIMHTINRNYRVDFAVSLAPRETIELAFVNGAPEIVPDPLHVAYQDHELTNEQQRIRLKIGRDALVRSVVYDGIEHLRSPIRIERATVPVAPSFSSHTPDFMATIAASLGISGVYPDGVIAKTKTEITACKSWATVSHSITNLPPGEMVTFTLPFATTAEKIVADFGTGNGTYAHIPAEANKEIVWRAEQAEAGWAWQVSVSGRLDYVGALLPHELAARNWLHAIDGNKSVAVAVLSPLEGLASLETRISGAGDIVTSFQTDGSACEERQFAVCYHFLNALPPIAAATNPHSILEPPVVELIQGQR